MKLAAIRVRHACSVALLTAALVAPLVLRADLGPAKAEPNLEKRSKLALDNALGVLKEARKAYDQGDLDQSKTLIDEVKESVELAAASLNETGKNPRRSPKWFKRAELETRELLRRIDSFQNEMSFVDRPLLDPLRTKVQQVHDDLLTGLMEGKRK